MSAAMTAFMPQARGWIGPDLVEALAMAAPGAVLTSAGEPLPSTSGAYVLVLMMEGAVKVGIAGRAARLEPGIYLYCGSARGPGGIRARLGRHLRGPARPRWHVDRISPLASRRDGLAVPDGSECALAAALADAGAIAVVPGFGASDCRRCPSHLLRWPDRGQSSSFR